MYFYKISVDAVAHPHSIIKCFAESLANQIQSKLKTRFRVMLLFAERCASICVHLVKLIVCAHFEALGARLKGLFKTHCRLVFAPFSRLRPN